MNIVFPADRAAATSAGVNFVAVVDGQSLQCVISIEALEDHFGATSAKASDLMHAYIANKGQIHDVARRKIPGSAGPPQCMIVSADFGSTGSTIPE